MHMKRNQMKTYNLRRRIVSKNAEGGSHESYEDAVEIRAIIWQASGEMDIKAYGEKVNYIKHMHYEGSEVIKEGDGICVNEPASETPDYIVKSVNADFMPIQIELEAR